MNKKTPNLILSEMFMDNLFLSLIEEARSSDEYYNELFGKIIREVGDLPENTKKVVIGMFEVLKSNDRINYYTPHIKVAYLVNLRKMDKNPDDGEKIESLIDSEIARIENKEGSYIPNPLNMINQDINHFFGSEVYSEYLRRYTFSGKKITYSEHKREMDAIITKMEERGSKYLDITSSDVDGQKRIIQGKDSKGLYYEWWDLMSNSCNTKESKLMGHCGSNSRADNMYSLRIPLEKHLQKEYNLTDKEFRNLRYPVLTMATNGKTLVESHGKHNNKPEEIYHEAIVDFISNGYIDKIDQTGSHLPENTFKLDDLSIELREKVGDIEETETFQFDSWGDMEEIVLEQVYTDLNEKYPKSTDFPEMELKGGDYGSIELHVEHTPYIQVYFSKKYKENLIKFLNMVGIEDAEEFLDDYWMDGYDIDTSNMAEALMDEIETSWDNDGYEIVDPDVYDDGIGFSLEVKYKDYNGTNIRAESNEYGVVRLDGGFMELVNECVDYISEHIDAISEDGLDINLASEKSYELITDYLDDEDVLKSVLKEYGYDGVSSEDYMRNTEKYYKLGLMGDSFTYYLNIDPDINKKQDSVLSKKKKGDVVNIDEIGNQGQMNFDFYDEIGVDGSDIIFRYGGKTSLYNQKTDIHKNRKEIRAEVGGDVDLDNFIKSMEEIQNILDNQNEDSRPIFEQADIFMRGLRDFLSN